MEQLLTLLQEVWRVQLTLSKIRRAARYETFLEIERLT
jgi:hypothetical protein